MRDPRSRELLPKHQSSTGRILKHITPAQGAAREPATSSSRTSALYKRPSFDCVTWPRGLLRNVAAETTNSEFQLETPQYAPESMSSHIYICTWRCFPLPFIPCNNERKMNGSLYADPPRSTRSNKAAEPTDGPIIIIIIRVWLLLPPHRTIIIIIIGW